MHHRAAMSDVRESKWARLQQSYPVTKEAITTGFSSMIFTWKNSLSVCNVEILPLNLIGL